MKKNKRTNSKAITSSQIRNAVQKKVERMENELKRNPTNSLTTQRLGEFRKTHASKLEQKTT